MAIRRSSVTSVTSAANRAARVANLSTPSADGATTYANGDTGKTPDYHLPWTGAVVEETLRKMMEFDPSTAGGVIVLESSEGSPANADTVLDPGNYTANFMTGTSWPSEITGVTPTNLIVYEKDGIIYQLVEAMGDRFVRYSTDSGTSWSAWSEKAVNSGGIDTSGEPDTPKDDPFQDLVDRVDSIENQIETIVGGDTVSIGSTEEGQAILDGTFDYDTGTITGS